MTEKDNNPDFEIVNKVIKLLDPLSKEDRFHMLNVISTWYKSNLKTAEKQNASKKILTIPGFATTSRDSFNFSDRAEVSPKEFLLEKMPQTDVEKVACLAYYLTHWRETPNFKTIDISKLNTEAAQRKLSNATQAMKNAVSNNYLTNSTVKNCRQLSAMGEQYVNALPDRAAASDIRKKMRPRQTRRTKKT